VNNKLLKEKANDLVNLTLNCVREWPALRIVLMIDMQGYIDDPVIKRANFIPEEERNNIFIIKSPRKVAELIKTYNLTIKNSHDDMEKFGRYLSRSWQESFFDKILKESGNIGHYNLLEELKDYPGVNLKDYLEGAVG